MPAGNGQGKILWVLIRECSGGTPESEAGMPSLIEVEQNESFVLHRHGRRPLVTKVRRHRTFLRFPHLGKSAGSDPERPAVPLGSTWW